MEMKISFVTDVVVTELEIVNDEDYPIVLNMYEEGSPNRAYGIRFENMEELKSYINKLTRLSEVVENFKWSD